MISLIISVYNCERFIETALQSVFSQTLPCDNYEIIVVNDGSTDNTMNILDQYQDRIKIINQPNQGLPISANRGILEAKGDYIMRLDADDYFDKEILSLTLGILESSQDYHCVYTDRYEVNFLENTRLEVTVGEDNVFDMLSCGVLFRTETFKRIGMYKNLLFEEYDLMIRFFDYGLRAFYLRQPLYYYVRNGLNMTNQVNYWKDGWKQLVCTWGEEKLKKYVEIQAKIKGVSRFQIA